jgi:flagellin
MSKTMEQLSTGKRINSASDDAAGLAISNKMTTQIRGLNQAVRNANDSISLLQTADGAMIEQTNMMQRMRELALQSANDTNTTDDRKYLDLEFQQLKEEINRIGNNTQWNGTNILDSSFKTGTGNFVFQVGANAEQTISRELGDFRTQGSASGSVGVTTGTGAAAGVSQVSTLEFSGTFAAGDVISLNVGEKSIQFTVTEALAGADTTAHNGIAAAIQTKLDLGTGSGITVGTAAASLTFTGTANTPFEISVRAGGALGNINGSEITDKEKSNSAVRALDVSLRVINEARAEIGSTINRLNYAADNMANVSMNTSASRSRILDTDYAKASAELARTQIISQAANAMLAQANQMPQAVLQLLQ